MKHSWRGKRFLYPKKRSCESNGRAMWPFFVLVVLILAISEPVFARTLMIDASMTLVELNLQTLTEGDSVLFQRGGTWNGHIEAESGVHYGAFGIGPSPVIDGDLFCIYGKGVDDVTIENLDLRNFSSSGIVVLDGHGWTIRDNHIESRFAQRYAIWISTFQADALFSNHVIENNKIGQLGNHFSDSVRVGAINVSNTQNILIRGNIIQTKYRPAIRTMLGAGSTNSRNVTIENNYIGGSWGNIIIWNSDDVLVRNNTIISSHGCGICVSFGSSRTRITNNIIHDLGRSDNLWNGIDVNGDTSPVNDGIIVGNSISAVNCHALMLSSVSGWRVLHNRFDASENQGDGCFRRKLALSVKSSNIDSNYNEFVTSGDGNGDSMNDSLLIEKDDQLLSLIGWRLVANQDQFSTVR